MSHLEPTSESFAALAAMAQEEGPIEMINLLRYRAQAAYPAGSAHSACSGHAAYMRYGLAVQPFLQMVGGQIVWHGLPKLMVIGPVEKAWDEALIVRYPSVAAFVRMVTDPGYPAIAVHRTAALEDSRLIMARPTAPPA
jgi:uncharacterized protein (DUF1330 family)